GCVEAMAHEGTNRPGYQRAADAALPGRGSGVPPLRDYTGRAPDLVCGRDRTDLLASVGPGTGEFPPDHRLRSTHGLRSCWESFRPFAAPVASLAQPQAGRGSSAAGNG